MSKYLKIEKPVKDNIQKAYPTKYFSLTKVKNIIVNKN